MGIIYFKKVSDHIYSLFNDTVVVEDSILLAPSPFKSLFLPQKKIAFHLVALNAPFLNALESSFFADWATHAELQGIHVVHIWEDRWLCQKDIILSQLASLAKKTRTIFARNTIAKRISKPAATDFLDRHHVGGSPTARYKYGLFLKKTDELVGVATFSAPRKFNREGSSYQSYELIRYASAKGTTLTGGLSKLLAAFRNEVHPDDIMTYADRDWYTGKSYAPLGFKMVELTPPLTFWVDIATYARYTKAQLRNAPKAENECIKVYNTGSRKFLLRLK